MTPEALGVAAILYVAAMFLLAHAADRAASAGRWSWMNSPVIYTLSLSVYCSAWTFYGAVGYATQSGLEYMTIYLGPGIVFAGAWWGLRHLVRVARLHRVTSIADLISSRFGKSAGLAALVTLIAVVAVTPYIALQLQSVQMALSAFAEPGAPLPRSVALWTAIGLAAFTILFGTRNLAADERHHGVVMAIALEAVVKLAAFLAVGAFVLWGVADGPADVLARIDRIATTPEGAGWVIKPDRWVVLITLAGAAVLVLPRMFQVLVVEASDDDRLRHAGWAFPLYLFAMTFLVLPIAVMGRDMLPASANPDLYVLELPLSQGHDRLAGFAFIGGFSSAMSMVVVSAIAVATMMANHWLVPVWLWLRGFSAQSGQDGEDLRALMLNARRIAILAIVGGGWAYHQISGGTSALAVMGIVAFSGMAQVLPAMIAGLCWRGATRSGAMAGIGAGALIWLALIFLPSLGLVAAPTMPQGIDPFAAAVLLSLGANMLLLIVLSLADFPNPVERMQAFSFVHAIAPDSRARDTSGIDRAEAMLTLARRFWGTDRALAIFSAAAEAQGKSGYLPDLTPRFLSEFERELAGTVGAATAVALMAHVAGRGDITVADLMEVAGEASQARADKQRLETAGEDLARSARKLQEANEKLTKLSAQKDAFLGQISHELRTPMTSIRAFSEILMEPLSDADRARFATIIHDEAARMTRLIEDLLDLAVLEAGQARLIPRVVNLHELIERALVSARATLPGRDFAVLRDIAAEQIMAMTDADRLLQVLLNVILNACKYCDAAAPQIAIRTRKRRDGVIQIDIADNGAGIPPRDRALIFEKFSRLDDPARAGGAGLGLAICREIMEFLGGSIAYLPGQGGAAFRMTLPPRPPGIGGDEAKKAVRSII
ncbi:ATP-binding protein [Paracoccus shanxieyensis]|uniref:histidine kinase n=1 Tax=Paracoccus shanxieyensis TaxID=2675752 RepID=A0A6L6IXX3_9RHOB|nr:ATP-binding protein [Paracoccus shanxieyensis]MTH63910.1 sodium:solute symporter [Paracoccus shanxieyensis]MTH86578.1 sodium:solute symporter [Paracoccus shanxieyensis]